MTIGMTDFQTKTSELTTLGVNQTSDVCLARVNKEAFGKLCSIEVKNKGRGNVSFKLKKRGLTYPITAENKNLLRVGSTDWFRGPLVSRRVTPGSVVIVDANGGVPQRVEDTDADGVLWQTDGPAGPTYPKKVGEIEYNEGRFDFTFEVAVTLAVLAEYKHTDWTVFSPVLEFASLAAGGGCRRLILVPDNAATFFNNVRDEEEVGFFAALLLVSDPETILGLVVEYFGDDSDIVLPIAKGEIYDHPYHNA